MKTALVTGFTSGIGKATAKALLMHYEMLLVCRNKQKGEEVIKAFLADNPSFENLYSFNFLVHRKLPQFSRFYHHNLCA